MNALLTPWCLADAAARFLIDDASNNTYYELLDEPGEVRP
jgi:hypothetical protein